MDADSSHFGLASPDLLEKIDRLFACNVGEYVHLPQLVVVGDQSSGKNSVLESLTKLPFPRQSGLCTRFATQITFRRALVKHVAVSVIAAQSSSEEHKEACRSWTVNTVMGLVSNESGTKSTFSSDVLRLEISGPKEEHLSIIDVPGIFKRTTSGVTTKSDMEMVEGMVHSYMRNPRSVMLTIVPANVDIATQEILEKAEEVDPDGNRTLGVLTKPDLVDKGAEKDVIDLVEGRKHALKLGWHILRNAGQVELAHPVADRHTTEKNFFAGKSPWNNLAKDRVGIDMLRTRLQEILADHIRREFPKVKSEITKKLNSCQRDLQALGVRRQTSAEQSRYLTEIAMEFQKLCADALLSNYGRSDVFDRNPTLRLATAVVNRSDLMSEDIATKGHTFHFESGDMENDSGIDHQELDKEGLSAVDVAVINLDDSDLEGTLEVRKVQDHPQLKYLLHAPKTLPEPRGGTILAWLKKVYHDARGFELGTLNPLLLAITIKHQSMKWKSLAQGYISDIATMSHAFVVDLLRVVCPIERVRIGIMSMLMDPLVEKYRSAISHVGFLLEIELAGTPATLNHYFNDSLEKCRQRRMRARMENKKISSLTYGDVVKLDDVMQSHSMSNADHAIQDLHDILHSYYKVACKRFVDSLRMQAADYYLTTGPSTPLKLFSPAFVAEMTPEQLEEMAGEELVQKRRRMQLEKEHKDLEDGKKILG